ncbi:hypothetical protein AS156_30535 [Bradyrhizobium macuxiense]|uniref:Uncharacterized protein n=1 Tax=Bradyrhizobium macuxiense TaxID=1755647 RepID=A0A109K3H7_9BRAD|nr:hypothetical protein [Bradyrhizobium macuxiense]KWV59759.1 hypothetical protein AS156_30535 [Bradyrhizobium macuxiense]
MTGWVEDLTQLSNGWKAALFSAAVLLALFACYLLLIAMPVALTAVSHGRGITFWVFEIGPNRTCEHAHEILANSAANNEIALYGNLAETLLRSSENSFVLEHAPPADAGDTSRSSKILAMLNQVRTTQDKLAGEREAIFKAIDRGCLQPLEEPGQQTTLTWKMVSLVLGALLLLLAFAYFVIAKVIHELSVNASETAPAGSE